MQEQLFPADAEQPLELVEAAAFDPALGALAASLPTRLRFGTSSWHYPGWSGLVWRRDYPRETLSRHGLAAYARHPLLRTVGVDRTFYRPLSAAQFAAMAEQVPDDFRFVVKAPNRVTDALLRDDVGRGRQPNPDFLSADCALRDFVEPALAGLGSKLGALVFQISPLPAQWLARTEALVGRLHSMLAALPDPRPDAPDGVLAVEVRDPQWLTPGFIRALKDGGATYCMGVHAKMPPLVEQLPILRALWPGPLVCRWNFNPRHGAFGYEEARRLYLPYDRLVDEDLATRSALARVIAGTVGAGQNAFVTLSNKSEGCAPLSVAALARAVVELRR
ncbi:DUF72 domain-containing protein [Azoarcus indigens]|uniref:Uncharacterized protein DUF72 n=1 Tax=Azoarcus indigens TaxID=29545 RepID=A0A4R6DM66_9RHOO|nr:DUF72 domain-containing protein [Azoarcus indigens]TDN46015.1 uncharacterized protein DUF72 [Azoarcus indigens]